MMPEQGAPERRAALTMHALSAADRAWVLAALPSVQRDRLGPMLAELEGLGIPRDATLVAEVAGTLVRHHPDRQTHWPVALDDACVAALARVLEREPPGLTGTLLFMQAWTWAPKLLAAMDVERREQVKALSIARAPAPRLHQAILEALRCRVEGEAENRPRDKEWRGLLSRMGWRP